MDQITKILDRLLALHPKEIDLSLGRMHRLLAALDHPEQRLPPAIHIAGTNGKGSVTATMRAILEASGKRCHVYTSPHLVSFNERIRLGSDGKFVSDPLLFDALHRCEEANAGAEITFFEITTAAALLLFAEQPADILLLEVGLGGRLDATNVVDEPLVSIITPVSMDHEKFLGNDLAVIAREKAGIIKHGVPVICAAQEDTALPEITRQAARNRALIQVFGQDFIAQEDQGRMAFQDEEGLIDLPLPVLGGRHQFENAALAIAALKVAHLLPGEATIADGLKHVNWPGRLQPLTHGALLDMCPAGAEVWIDGGHNPGAGISVAQFMGEQEERTPRPLYLIAGMLTTKDPVGYFRPFHGLVRHVGTVPISTTSTGRTPEDLADLARCAGLEATPFQSLDAALADVAACAQQDGEAPRILICGSLYLAGEALARNGMAPD
ncbi:bifunctional folylpolyglutamate synthase/dihydrofolate synthase [Roseibium porphyridii]|uniref:Bifunctional folylpolyglutamate synthase/dihydrofolate synthase n=1 Tax=Roseibium porphyridii TaxID=2866279 RepID=A0ABY8F7E0_9HYPH|nr:MULTISPECIES: folylpolyglutamate synthase/dihydrofolate synthase family protein [Stappiaceae]QFT29031.1 Folylpolyglutamate synthase [Labrenzia sp. THAF82]WFE90032.1 bifunctional folylpolyglutamate synthase/dihydrofolate synthase [Roseibium sp. KMA01]